MVQSTVDIPVYTPKTLTEALTIRDTERADALPVAGGTDVMVWRHNEPDARPGAYLSLWGVPELRHIEKHDGHITIGATTTFADIARSRLLEQTVPALVEAARSVGAAQIQNRATIGGNIINGSPAGDSLPVLAVNNATLVLQSKTRGVRKVPFEAFFTGYRKTVLGDDELLVDIAFPVPRPGTWSGFEKVGSRRAQTISKVMAALQARVDDGKLYDVALAYGAVAPTIIRLPRTEARLEAQVPSEQLADRVSDTLHREIAPIDDLRSTAAYRRFAAVGLLRRLLRRCAALEQPPVG